MDEVAAYWHQNPKRWHRALRKVADVCDMYELQRPDSRSFERLPPWVLLDQFFWNTSHRRAATVGIFNTPHDPVLDVEPEYDGPTCWGCIIGILDAWALQSSDIRFILDVSGGRVTAGHRLWRQFSPDFRTMFLGLAGDMRKKALRHMVLGDLREGWNG